MREHGLLRSVLQGNEPLVLQSTRLSGPGRRTHLIRRQPIEILDVVDRYGAIGRRLEHVLAEFGGESCDLCV